MGLLDSLAAKGRNGDTKIAHLTPGEVVIPKEVAALRPDLIAHIGAQLKKMGGNPSELVVGRGRTNPATGIEEFATADEVAAAYQQYLGRAPESQAAIDYWVGQGDLSSFGKAASAELTQRAPEVQSSVAQAYRDNFGREAETQGADYWANKVTSGELAFGDLNKTIRAGAGGDDIIARDDGAQYPTAWRSELNPNTDPLRYDATKDQWNPIKKPVVPGASAPMQYAPNFASAVDAPTETIEGRMERLLAANNPVIRQAGDRAMQAFADRGLLNSSMAQQASYEAMVSKAIEIAGPDAERYFSNRRQNVDWTNKFAQNEQQFGYDMQKLERSADLSKDSAAANHQLNTQTNYQQAIANVQQMHAQQLAAVQGAQMDPQDKQFAIENMTVTRDNSIRLLTATFQQFPGWQSEWSSLVSMLPSG